MPFWVSLTLVIVGCIMLVGYLLVYHYKLLGKILARSIGGVAAIIIINYLLYMVGVQSSVGVNPYTILTTGFLGIQGLVFLYITACFLALFY